MIAMNPATIQARLSHVLDEGGVHLHPIPAGTFNTSFWVTTERGNRYVWRIAPGSYVPVLFYEREMMRREPHVHRLVRDRTQIPVPNVVYSDLSGRLVARPSLLVTALPGRPLSDTPVEDPDRVKEQLGVYLRQLHQIRGPRFGYLDGHEPQSAYDNWPEAFQNLWRQLLRDIASLGLYTPSEVGRHQRLLDRHLGHLNAPSQATLLHMDLWAQNILTDGRGITGIIDWERALWGDPEMDLVLLERACLIDESFWRGYGRRPEFTPSFFIRRAFYLLYEHQKHIFIYAARHRDSAASRRHLTECRKQLHRMHRGDFAIPDPRRLGGPDRASRPPSEIRTCDGQCGLTGPRPEQTNA